MIPKGYYFNRGERGLDVFLHGVKVGHVHEIDAFDYWDITSQGSIYWGVEEVLSKYTGIYDNEVGYADVLKESKVYRYAREAESALIKMIEAEFTEEEIKAFGAQQKEEKSNEKRNLSWFERATKFIRR